MNATRLVNALRSRRRPICNHTEIKTIEAQALIIDFRSVGEFSCNEATFSRLCISSRNLLLNSGQFTTLSFPWQGRLIGLNVHIHVDDDAQMHHGQIRGKQKDVC